MDAMKFLSEAKRMCSNAGPCSTCDVNKFCVFTQEFPIDFGTVDQMQKMVKLVEKWAEEHPCKTRQSEFLKQYPEASISKHGVLLVCPCPISASHRDAYGGCATIHRRCDDCRKEYWLQEVE